MKAYINYPDPHISIHRNSQCAQLHKHDATGRRIVVVNASNLGQVLSDFITNKYDFGSRSPINDLYLDVSLGTPAQEEGVVHVVHALLGRRYRRLRDATVKRHACK